ncbi:hypothetical protein Cgig2_007974 [Carnegiea gigantea]|uniref:Uncharacterized protein n=1 Tax=Carnegiea gigantea TaxID=171969 RepID=A0A9Q1GNW4_9CARY|nr:hypothetical protein Cgig2_007974 [Carnegiea gigantea]
MTGLKVGRTVARLRTGDRACPYKADDDSVRKLQGDEGRPREYYLVSIQPMVERSTERGPFEPPPSEKRSRAKQREQKEKERGGHGPRHKDPHHRCPVRHNHREVRWFQGYLGRYRIPHVETRPRWGPQQLDGATTVFNIANPCLKKAFPLEDRGASNPRSSWKNTIFDAKGTDSITLRAQAKPCTDHISMIDGSEEKVILEVQQPGERIKRFRIARLGPQLYQLVSSASLDAFYTIYTSPNARIKHISLINLQAIRQGRLIYRNAAQGWPINHGVCIEKDKLITCKKKAFFFQSQLLQRLHCPRIRKV